MSLAQARSLVPLVPPPLAPLLGSLALPRTRKLGTRPTGLHPVPKKGQSVEFFEHRSYLPGDELRRIDWRASAKGERTMVRYGEHEQNAPVYIFLDDHAGMAYGSGEPPQRWSWARGIASLLAYCALRDGDPMTLVRDVEDLDQNTPAQQLLERAPRTGASRLAPTLKGWSAQRPGPGRIFILSDWLDLSTGDKSHKEVSSELFSLLGTLRQQGHAIWGLELLHQDELELDFSASPKHICFTDPQQRRPTKEGSPEALREDYLKALGAHRAELAQKAKERGMHWCPMRNDLPWAQQLHQHLHATPELA